MKKIYKALLIVLATLAIFIGLYYIQYPTKEDRASLESEIQSFQDFEGIKIQNEKIIDNKIIAMYTFNGGMGYAIFNKGINGRCLLTSAHNSNGDTILIGCEETSKDSYKVFAGKNYDNKINTIEFIDTDERRITVDVSKEDYYILALSNLKEASPMGKFNLYDANGNSIKEEIISKYLRYGKGGDSKFKMELKMFDLWYVVVTFISGICIYLIYKPSKKENIATIG
ncbi:hypothetical protein [Clostridium tunisiense]|uniref:hypothetical protein n=1 Tax=Clostridium tunisiense TaxID=219748 RepID=UPI0003183D12|nr:hypothetical protein [Clostridium tunisiense]